MISPEDRNSLLEWENQRLRHWLLFWQGIGAAGIGWFVADMVWTVVS